MILGLSAATIGIVYALFKFAVNHYLHRLQEDISQVEYDQRRNKKRLTVLEDKLKVNHSRKQGAERETRRLRGEVKKLYTHLCTTLPVALHSELERCYARAPEPNRAELKLLHDLKMTDQLSEALAPLSMLILEIRAEKEIEKNRFKDQLTTFLQERDLRFHSPQSKLVVTLFDHPGTAVEFVRQFIAHIAADGLVPLAAGLYTGVHVTDEKSTISHLLAGTLNHAADLMDRAPDFALVMNEKAYQTLEDHRDIEDFESAPPTFFLPLIEPESEEEAQVAP